MVAHEFHVFVPVWDVQEAVDYVKQLADYKPWFIEEPTAPDDILGHANIRKQLKPYGIGVGTPISPCFLF